MFGSSTSGAHAYAKVGMETGVVAASPHRLIVMLFDGAIIATRTALKEMQATNIAAKGQAISKAISIIDCGLRASLDKSVGGEIASNLDALYEYMSHQLLLANLNNDTARLEEVIKLLSDLKEAWCSIDETQEDAQPAPAARPAYDPLAPNISTLVKA
jgi:flagellar protein FliS